MIDWQPITEFGDRTKRSRSLLIWIWGDAYLGRSEPEGWYVGDDGVFTTEQPTYFAEITPPT